MLNNLKVVALAVMYILGQVVPAQAVELQDTKQEKEIVCEASETVSLTKEEGLAAYAYHVSIVQEQIVGDPDHSHREDGYIDPSIFEWLDDLNLQYVNANRIHPQILSYEDYILQKINSPEWHLLFEEVLGGWSYDKSVFVKDIVLAIMEVETGRGFSDDEYPSDENSGYGWGLFQIEDISYGKSNSRSSMVDCKNKNEIIYDIDLNDRLDPEKSIDWFLAHFHNLLWKTNGDYSKAIQSYNYGIFGLQWLIEDYDEYWYQNLDKICQSISIRTGSPMRAHGDSGYLFKVLSYID